MIATISPEAVSADVKLTTMQSLFVDKYVSCLNATKSAIAAGYSQSSARQIASQLLKNVNVKSAIEARLKAKLPESDEVTPVWIRKTVKDTIKECVNPKDKFTGLELLARVTPGTLDPLPAQSNTLNFFAVLGKLGSLPALVMPEQPPPVAAQHPPAIIKQPSPTSKSLPVDLDVIDLDKTSKSAEKSSTPHDGCVSENTPTQKFVDQKL